MALKFLNNGYFAGKVGIGTETPGAKLDVDGDVLIKSGEYISWGTVGATSIEGSTASNKLQFRTNSADRMIINSSGNVGIGTTSPTQPLEVHNTIKIGETGVAGGRLISGDSMIFQIDSDNNSGSSSYRFRCNGTADDGTELMRIQENGNVGIGTTSPTYKFVVSDSGAAGIEFGPEYAGDTNLIQHYDRIGAAYMDVNHIAQNHRFGRGASEWMRITSAGNVGIGTSSPDYKLDIGGTTASVNNVARIMQNNGGTAIRIGSGGGSSDVVLLRIDGNSATGGHDGASNSSNYGFSFKYFGLGSENANRFGILSDNQTAATQVEAISILQDGKVGIGTDSPTYPLDVSGIIKTSSSFLGNTAIIQKVTALNTNGIQFTNNGGSEKMRITDAGNVGIGTTSPQQKFVVNGGPITAIASDGAYNAGYFAKLSSDYGPNALKLTSRTGNVFLASDYGSSVTLQTGNPNAPALYINANKRVQFNGYNSTNQTGTPTYLLGTDASGNIVKTNTVPGSAAGPYLPLAGGTMTGVTQFNDHTNYGDQVYAKFGASQDLQIYHDGSNSYIVDTGTGTFNLRGSTQVIIGGTNGEVGIQYVENAGVGLRHNNVTKLTTESTGVAVVGNITVDSALLSNQENTDIDTGAEAVAQVAHATYTAAFFDFVVKKGTNVRSGTVYACHDGTNVEFTETSTQDLGDTSDVVLSVDISGTQMRLIATVASDNWSVKSLVKAI